jgi:hypothetical protein
MQEFLAGKFHSHSPASLSDFHGTVSIISKSPECLLWHRMSGDDDTGNRPSHFAVMHKPSEVNFSVESDWVEGEPHSVLTNDPIRMGFSSPEYLLRG